MKAASSSSNAGMRSSGTKIPPNLPNLPSDIILKSPIKLYFSKKYIKLKI
jgi:hypothetical protein